MINSNYNFDIEILSPDGDLVKQYQINKDQWKGAVEYTQFSGIQSGQLPATNTTATASIDPVWSDKGKPHVAHARITVFGEGENRSCKDISPNHFDSQAHKFHQAYLKQFNSGANEASQTFSYRITAHRKPAEPDSGKRNSSNRPRVIPVAQPLAIREISANNLLDNSVVFDQRAELNSNDDITVFMHPEALAKANMIARNSGDVECGGVLIGSLCKDAQHPQHIFMEITDQIMAENVQSDKTKLTFTHETWNGILQQIAARNSDESILGWWHKHPNWCRQCPQDKKAACKINSVFFSDDDRSLHRLVFPRAYHVALLLTERDPGMITSMFGWREGLIQPRNFYLLNSDIQPLA